MSTQTLQGDIKIVRRLIAYYIETSAEWNSAVGEICPTANILQKFELSPEELQSALYQMNKERMIANRHVVYESDEVLIQVESAWVEDPIVAKFTLGPKYKSAQFDAKSLGRPTWKVYDDGFQITSDSKMAKFRGRLLGLTRGKVKLLECVLKQPKGQTIKFSELTDIAVNTKVQKRILTYISVINKAIKNAGKTKKMEEYILTEKNIGCYRKM